MLDTGDGGQRWLREFSCDRRDPIAGAVGGKLASREADVFATGGTLVGTWALVWRRFAAGRGGDVGARPAAGATVAVGGGA
jgi:hypothetical protein